MAGEEKYLDKNLKDVLSEMSKAPGGAPSQPRPVTPGPILGGPPKEPVPGKVDPATGVRTVRDPAREIFRFYAYGKERASTLPPAPEDTKKVTVSDKGLTPKEKAERKALKEAGRKVTTTAERKAINAAVRAGVITGLTRAPGSKPPLTVIPEAIAKQAALNAARRKAEIQIIRDALERFGISSYYGKINELDYLREIPKNVLTVEEKKYLDSLARKIDDMILKREAEIKEKLAARGNMTSAYEDYKAQQEADRRTLEGRKVAERNRVSRAKTEKAVRPPINPPTTPRLPMGAIPPIMPGGGLLDQIK